MLLRDVCANLSSIVMTFLNVLKLFDNGNWFLSRFANRFFSFNYRWLEKLLFTILSKSFINEGGSRIPPRRALTDKGLWRRSKIDLISKGIVTAEEKGKSTG